MGACEGGTQAASEDRSVRLINKPQSNWSGEGLQGEPSRPTSRSHVNHTKQEETASICGIGFHSAFQ